MRYLFNSTIKLDLIDLCRHLFLIPITNEVENCVSLNIDDILYLK